jgi:hypothetical protein
VNSKSSFSEKTHEATKKKTIRKEREYFRDSKTVFSFHQFHRDFREYCAMNRKCQFDRLSTKTNFINRRFWAIDETKHRWECLWCFDSFFQTFSLWHHDRFSLFRQKKKARRRFESYSFEERAELESSREEKKKEKEDEDEKRKKEKKEKKRKKKRRKRKRMMFSSSKSLQTSSFRCKSSFSSKRRFFVLSRKNK